ncbi:MAG: type III pantothenate kinase [candidate division WOR-3 bacterium]
MILTLDVGNTNIHIGVYQNERLIKAELMETKKYFDRNLLRRLFNQYNIEGVGIASVVPTLNQRLRECIEKVYDIKPIFISSGLKLPVKIAYKQLGADRIANVCAGFFRYHTDLIIFSFGTAVTGDVISKKGVHLGGIIMPGIKTQIWSLSKKTVLVKHTSLSAKINYLGKNTRECVQSGVFYGIVFSIQGFIKKVEKDIRTKYQIIATGGWGRKMAKAIPRINKYDQDLTLYGILKLYHYNAQK